MPFTFPWYAGPVRWSHSPPSWLPSYSASPPPPKPPPPQSQSALLSGGAERCRHRHVGMDGDNGRWLAQFQRWPSDWYTSTYLPFIDWLSKCCFFLGYFDNEMLSKVKGTMHSPLPKVLTTKSCFNLQGLKIRLHCVWSMYEFPPSRHFSSLICNINSIN